jgi:hypothetical protein
MTNESTFNDISSLVNDIQEGAVLVAREQGIMPLIVRVFRDNQSMDGRKLYRSVGGTVGTISESTDMSSQTFTPSALSTISPSIYGAQYFLTDARIASAWYDEQALASQDLGEVLGVSADKALLSSFTSLTGGTVGTAGSVIQWSNFFSMASILRSQNAPLPYRFVCHPYTWDALAKKMTVGASATNSPAAQDEAFRNFWVSNVGGIDIYVDGNITAGTAAVCAMFSQDAFAFDVRRPMRIEVQRDASRSGGGYELNATMIFGAGVWRATFGVQGTFDASAPS